MSHKRAFPGFCLLALMLAVSLPCTGTSLFDTLNDASGGSSTAVLQAQQFFTDAHSYILNSVWLRLSTSESAQPIWPMVSVYNNVDNLPGSQVGWFVPRSIPSGGQDSYQFVAPASPAPQINLEPLTGYWIVLNTPTGTPEMPMPAIYWWGTTQPTGRNATSSELPPVWTTYNDWPYRMLVEATMTDQSQVPEPATLLLVPFGLLAIQIRRRQVG